MILDREATLEKLAALTAEAAGQGAELVVFPETFVSVYPSSTWAKALAGWGDPGARAAFAALAREAVEVPGPAADRLGALARENGVWLVTGVNEVDPGRNGTVYNALLYHAPDGSLALKHRKLVPTNHERLVWGQGDGEGLRAIETPLGRIGGLICWENYMPLARFSLYESGIEIYLASTARQPWRSWLPSLQRRRVRARSSSSSPRPSSRSTPPPRGRKRLRDGAIQARAPPSPRSRGRPSRYRVRRRTGSDRSLGRTASGSSPE